MSALLGIPFAANSVGILPLHYLHTSTPLLHQAEVFLANAIQIHDQYLIFFSSFF